MDSILALGHFCESHGPCVILNTQRYKDPPGQGPQNLMSPCEACQSLELDQAFLSRDDNYYYVTTRTPLQKDLHSLLKHGTVRSLSCEQEGTLYFGDIERGHVISHSFTVHDSLARGFQRKYAILMLMRDKVDLLNMWPLLLKNLREISKQLKEYSADVNEKEQAQKSQRALRQAQVSSGHSGRSLSQLTGKPAIFAHLHLWFVWLLGCQIAIEVPLKKASLPNPKPSTFLRILYQDMGEVLFREVCSLMLIGVPLKSSDNNVILAFYSLFPSPDWTLHLDNSHYCNLNRHDSGKWQIESDVELPTRISTFQKDIEHALSNCQLTECALEPQLTTIISQWQHTARVLCWCPQIDLKLLQSLNVQKCDVQLLIFWTSQCIDCVDKYKLIVKTLNSIFSNI